MSARPRLVQEGTPIYGANSSTNNSGTSRTNNCASGEASFSRPTRRKRMPHSSSSSSLSRSKAAPLKTSLVIGGAANNDALVHHDHIDMEVVTTVPKTRVAKKQSSRHSFVVTGEPVPPQTMDVDASSFLATTTKGTNHVTNPPGHHHYVLGTDDNTINPDNNGEHNKMDEDDYDSDCDKYQYDDRVLERMEGVEDHTIKGPLIVMDGANIAYAYADAMASLENTGTNSSSLLQRQSRREPDSRGIQVAANYFLSSSVGGGKVRVLVVIPAPWFRSKPRPGDVSNNCRSSNAKMVTPQLEVLKDLKARGLLVCAPPSDDDDAYAIMIARREDSRSQKLDGSGGGFVLSNDMFRDAVKREGDDLKEWLNIGRRCIDSGNTNGPGRISFAFCDMGSRDDYGDHEMDFVPNPRHGVIGKIESQYRSN